MKENLESISYALVFLSAVIVGLATYGTLSQRDIWLAPTQWLLVAIAVAVYAIYAKLASK